MVLLQMFLSTETHTEILPFLFHSKPELQHFAHCTVLQYIKTESIPKNKNN